jgi:phage shock protein A
MRSEARHRRRRGLPRCYENPACVVTPAASEKWISSLVAQACSPKPNAVSQASGPERNGRISDVPSHPQANERFEHVDEICYAISRAKRCLPPCGRDAALPGFLKGSRSMSLKTRLTFGIVLPLVVAATVGVSKMRATQHFLADHLRRILPAGIRDAEVDDAISDGHAEVTEARRKLAEVEVKRESYETELAALKARASEEAAINAKATALLSQTATSFVVGGRALNRTDVGEDQARRVPIQRALLEKITTTAGVAKKLETASAALRGAITKKEAGLVALAARRDALLARNEAARTVADVTQGADVFLDQNLGAVSRANKQLDQIEAETRLMEKATEPAVGSPSLINWSGAMPDSSLTGKLRAAAGEPADASERGTLAERH